MATEAKPYINLSVVAIASYEDMPLLDEFLANVPDGCEVVILFNKRGETCTDPALVKEMVIHNNVVYTAYEMQYTEPYKSFAELRNLAGQYATRSWVLAMDMDERLADASRDWFDKNLDKYPQGIAGLFVGIAGCMRNIEEPDTVTRYNESAVRLYRNLSELYYVGDCHEQIIYSVQRAGYNTADCSVQILHSGYTVDPARLRAKLQRNVYLLAKTFVKIVDIDADNIGFFTQLLARDSTNFLSLLDKDRNNGNNE